MLQSEITSLRLYLNLGNIFFDNVSILVSEVQEIIEWFEKLLFNKSVEPKLLILDNQFYFDLLENDSNSKVILITYDTTIPVPGNGGYYLPSGAKKEEFFKKTSIKFEMDNLEIERISKKLKAELQVELEIGSRVESKKLKNN
ncbi:hypothetical protein GOQ30_03070 [Flavobacterium sp. TP390]|uniref:Uncharacterized protein n=1 Tax=Flavobacterium profundi TaxID=1774945 RepID=A0A6I4IEW1_9FLAO|nr:hypothetical protein [Flavobacterium profundi]MVO08145.1 hypothetical protein [Flavobacterium profundi]